MRILYSKQTHWIVTNSFVYYFVMENDMTDELNNLTETEAVNVNGGTSESGRHPFPVSPYVVDAAHSVCCGTCVALCPVKAIAMTELSAVIRGHCIECGTCESACPANAIHKNV